MLNKLKKTGIISGIIVCTLYAIFLLIPLILSPILNSYSQNIISALEEATGYKIKIEKLGITTTPKLTAGITVKHAEFAIPTGEKFLEADNFKFKLSLLPILWRNIELDEISADNFVTMLKVRQDGHFLIEEYLPQADPDVPVSTLQPLPLGIKLSNHLPNIKVKSYDICFVDMSTNKPYSLSGKDFKITDFILDKKVKISANGTLSLNKKEQISYNVKLLNNIMPDISLNQLVFNPKTEETQNNSSSVNFNFIDIFKAFDNTELSADLNADIKIGGTISSPQIYGFADVENITMLVDGAKLPAGKVIFNAKKHNLKLDVDMYTSDNQKTSLIGKFKTGKHPNADIRFVSNAQFNNIFRVVNSIAKSFNYRDLETLSATGGVDADFTLKTNTKHITSSGYFNIPSASIKYPLYNVALNNITADIDFNNQLTINKAGLEVMGQPLKIYGNIKNNADTDLHINADKLLLKGLVAATGQVQVLKENTFNSGTLTLNADITGKLSKLIPSVNLSIDNFDVKNIPSNTRITLPKGELVINTDGKKFSGNLKTTGLKILNSPVVIAVPETEILIGEKDIDINKAYLLLNNSRIDIKGKIENYINEKMAININAGGNILASDIKFLVPADLRYMVSGKGAVPISVNISGNTKVQDIALKLSADTSNYFSILETDLLKGRKTLINSNMRISDDSIKFSNTGIFADDLNNPILSLTGGINNLSKLQKLALHISIPKRVNIVIPGLKNSNMGIRGDADVTGTLLNPYMKGLISIPVITIPDMATTINNLVANINGPILSGSATVQNFRSGGISADNLVSEFSLKNYSVFHLNNLMGDAFGGKISGNISYGINDGKITVSMKGSDLDAVKAIEGAAGIKNALSGKLSFDTNLLTKGATDVEIMKNLSGKIKFDVTNGKFLNVGRFDTLLYAQNIVGNAILKTAVTSVTNLPLIQNTAEFKSISGDLNLLNGWAQVNSIQTTGPLMAYYITGKYNLLNGTANIIILGRLDAKIVALLGPLGDLSVEKLTSYIPKFGTLTGKLINAMTSDPAKENTANIPALSGGSSNYKDFKVEFNGGLESTTSVKSFKWLSKCDTSAIDIKQDISSSVNKFKNSVQESKQNFQDKKDTILNSIQDTKQQFETTKEDLKNLFRF